MEYRQLPRGSSKEKFSVLGLGMGGIQHTPAYEIEEIINKAIENGINFFDLCAGGAVYEPFGRAIKGRREKVFLQVHFGAVYDENGEYGWCRDFDTIKKTFWWELEKLQTDYVDFGFLHCVDEDEDFDKLVEIGVLDYLKEFKEQGVVRHIGFSSHTPSVANRIIDTGLVDMMMFSINPAYDFEKGDEYGIGTVNERFRLFKRCETEGIGISVMKPFFAGQLLSKEQSPFGVELSHYQCLQYALDRPGVLTAVSGVQNIEHLDVLLGFVDASKEEKDYSIIGSFTADMIKGTCVYCNHCQPCPAGIDVGLVNKYYDLALAGDKIATNHYDKLSVKADACLMCGHCEGRCPFGVKQMSRMSEIANYFESVQKRNGMEAASDVSVENITLDKATAMAFCGDDEDLFRELFKEFTLLPIKEQLMEFFRNGDYKNYCIHVHGFKNTAYTMGARELGHMAFELEKLTREEILEDISEELLDLQDKMFKLYDAVCGLYHTVV